MSLRDQIDQFMADHDPTAGAPDAIDELFASDDFDGLDPRNLVDALRHYADTSSIEVADVLSGFLTDHSNVPLDEFDPATIDDGHSDFALVGFGAGQLVSEAMDSDDKIDDFDSDVLEVEDDPSALDIDAPDIDAAGGELDGADIASADIDAPGADNATYLTDADDDLSLDSDEQPVDEIDFDF